MRKTLTAIFGAVAIGGAGTSLYHIDRSHPHGFLNPYHETVDAISKAGSATPQQQRILVEATVQGARDTRKANVAGLVGAGGMLGFSIVRRRRK